MYPLGTLVAPSRAGVWRICVPCRYTYFRSALARGGMALDRHGVKKTSASKLSTNQNARGVSGQGAVPMAVAMSIRQGCRAFVAQGGLGVIAK